MFTAGRRPAAPDIRALTELAGTFTVSFDPSECNPAPSREEPQWLELLASGLTFDLAGLAPGPPAGPPPRGRSSSIEEAASMAEALILRPGPHLASGAGMMPVVRTLASLAASLGGLEGAAAVVWHAARCWSSPDVFRDSVLRWNDGGVFPALSLATLALSPDRGMHSEGLALFTGQELRLEPDTVDDAAEAAKLAVRLMDFLVERGHIGRSETIAGPDGLPLRLVPSENGRFVRVGRP